MGSPALSRGSEGMASTIDPFDIYKLGVEMADRVSARRASANGFFLAVHAAMTALTGILYPVLPGADRLALFPFGSLLTAMAGVTFAVAWWVSLRSYRDLNSAKFAVLTKLEEQLPVRLFTDEWQYLKQDPVEGWRKRYAELGQVEQVVPVVFLGVYLLAIATIFFGR
jgi:hypothetical protein